jgi:hypothetical protein
VLCASVLIVLGAMMARDVAGRLAAASAMAMSVLIGLLTWWFFSVNLVAPMRIGYGFYAAAVCAVGTLVCSIWALVATLPAASPARASRR